MTIENAATLENKRTSLVSVINWLTTARNEKEHEFFQKEQKRLENEIEKLVGVETEIDKTAVPDKKLSATIEIKKTDSEKSELKAKFVDHDPNYEEYFEERAAIMEYDGGLPRQEAERQAKILLSDQFCHDCD